MSKVLPALPCDNEIVFALVVVPPLRVSQAGVDSRDARHAGSAVVNPQVGLVVDRVVGVSACQGRLQVGLRRCVVDGLGSPRERRDRDREQNADDEQDNEELNKRKALFSRLRQPGAPRRSLATFSMRNFLNHRLPVPARHLEGPHRRPADRRHDDKEGLEDPSRPRRGLLPAWGEDLQQRTCSRSHPPRVSRRVELHGPLIAGSILGQPLSGIFTRTCRLRAAPVLWPRHSPTFRAGLRGSCHEGAFAPRPLDANGQPTLLIPTRTTRR